MLLTSCGSGMKFRPRANTRNSSTEGVYVEILFSPTFVIDAVSSARALLALGVTLSLDEAELKEGKASINLEGAVSTVLKAFVSKPSD